MTQVSHEVLGIVKAWAGLPVRRKPRPAPPLRRRLWADDSNAPENLGAD